jgi:hypothetical protein
MSELFLNLFLIYRRQIFRSRVLKHIFHKGITIRLYLWNSRRMLIYRSMLMKANGE